MSEPGQIPAEAPDLSVRAPLPEPRRLSRKVLLSGAALLGAIISAALIFGLGQREPRAHAPGSASSAQAGAPQTIEGAPAHYDAMDFAPPEDEAEPTPPAFDRPSSETRALADREDSAHEAGPAHREAYAQSEPQPTQAPILYGAHAAAQEGQSEDRLSQPLVRAPSPYALMAGSVIAAALLTELNSDIAGPVIAQITMPIYDSRSGRHLLIPQGARLIGEQSGSANYGDRRIGLSWRRLILPNGDSINLEEMPGGDVAGAAGLSDRHDQHLDRLAGAIGLSALLSVVANEAEDDESERISQSLGDAAAQEAARSGGRIIDRELSVRPTLRVRAGAPVRVLVTRDMVFR